MAGYTREPGQALNVELKSTTKLEQSGMVIALDGDGKGVLSNVNSFPYGIALNSTMDVQEFALTGDEIYKTGGSVAVTRSGQVKVPVANNNAVISKGDELAVSGATGQTGKVNKSVRGAVTDVAEISTEIDRERSVIGIAEESVPVGTTTTPGKEYVLVSLRIQGGLSP